MKRRDFLLGSASVALGSLLVTRLSAQANETTKGLKLGLTTYMIGSQWTLPQLIEHLPPLGILAVELRTDGKHAHSVELNLSKAERSAIRKRMADSPLQLIGIACAEEYHSPDPAVLPKSIERTKEYLQFCADLGVSGLRVRPNNFPKDVPHEKTLDQIAASLRILGATAEALNQELRVEAHGSVGSLPNMEIIAKKADHPKVRVLLNSNFQDVEGEGLLANLKKVGPYLGRTVHINDLTSKKYAEAKFYETQFAFLKSVNWDGWCLLEIGDKPDDEARLAELKRQRERWEELIGY